MSEPRPKVVEDYDAIFARLQELRKEREKQARERSDNASSLLFIGIDVAYADRPFSYILYSDG